MGTFLHAFTLIGESGESETLNGLVDTGSTFTSVPRDVLEYLGVHVFTRVRLRLADGQMNEVGVGEVKAQIDEYEPRTILCVFGEPGSQPLLGAHALEAFLLGVDPVEHQLIPPEGWWN